MTDRRVHPPSSSSTGRRGRPPFAPLRPHAITVGVFMVAAVIWTLAGQWLPGGRWLAVHLFTLGALTNAIVGFSRHFGTTLARQPEPWSRWPHLVLNLGIVAVLVGLPTTSTPLLAAGGTVVGAVVLHNWWDLRSKRRRAVGVRFDWVIRNYERAHGAFVLGALLGVLLGTGVVSGAWYGAARTAHLHVNVLGWGGLTLLATLVFFGPTVLRVRMEEHADVRARRWLAVGAYGLLAAVFGLLGSGVGGTWGTALRLVAAGGLALFGGATLVVCAPVLRVARGARPSVSGRMIRAACAWMTVAVAADVVVVAVGEWRLLDAVGLALLVGALAQAVVGAVGYVAPMFTRAGPKARARIRTVLERGAGLYPAAFNMGVALLVGAATVGATAGASGAFAIRSGWIVVAGFVLLRLGTTAAAFVVGRSAA